MSQATYHNFITTFFSAFYGLKQSETMVAATDRKLGHLRPCWKQHNWVFLARLISSQDCGDRNKHFKPKTCSFPNPNHMVFVPKPK